MPYDQPRPPHFPVWYVIMRRDPLMPLQKFGVAHIIAVQAGDLFYVDEWYKQNMLPYHNANDGSGIGIEYRIFARAPVVEPPGLVVPDLTEETRFDMKRVDPNYKSWEEQKAEWGIVDEPEPADPAPADKPTDYTSDAAWEDKHQ